MASSSSHWLLYSRSLKTDALSPLFLITLQFHPLQSTMSSTYASNLTAHTPAAYSKNASFVYSDAYTAPVLALLDAQPGERILDFGCGSGELTARLDAFVRDGDHGQSGSARQKDGCVWGVDSNQKMVRARSPYSTLDASRLMRCSPNRPQLDAAASDFPDLAPRLWKCDIQDLALPEAEPELAHSFDAVFTSATLHWCKRDPSGVIRGAKRALKEKGGRFVGELGGFMNAVGVRGNVYKVLEEMGVENAAELDPFYYPTAEQYKEVGLALHCAKKEEEAALMMFECVSSRQLLEAEGFTVDHASLTPRLTPLPTDLYGWLETFVRPTWLSSMDDATADRVMQEVVRRSEVDHRHPGMGPLATREQGYGQWALMYVRLRFSARLL